MHGTDELSPQVVMGLTLGVAAIGAEALVVSPLLADVARELDATPALIGQAVSAYGLALALVAPLFGLFGAALDRRVLMLGGLALFVLATLGCALAAGPWQLAAARAACGAGAGAFLPACYGFVADAVAYERRAKVMGRVMFGWSLSLVIGVPLGGIVGELGGWRAAFVAVAAGGLAALLIVASTRRIRLPSAAASPARPTWKLPAAVGRIFVLTFLNMLSFYGVYTYLGTAIRQTQAVESAAAGLYVLCYGAGLAVSTLRGDLLDRFGKVRALRLALLCLAPTLAVLPVAVPHPLLLAPLMIGWGMLQGAVLTGLTTVLTQASGPARTLATALNSSLTYLAVAVGAELGGLAMDGHGGFAAIGLAAGAANLLALSSLGIGREAADFAGTA